MKNIYVFLILLSVFLMQSCGSAKRMQKNLDKYCPLCPSETTTVIEYRDTTIEIPGETVTGKMVQTYDRQGAIKKEKIKSKSAKVTTKYNKDNSIKSVKVKRK